MSNQICTLIEAELDRLDAHNDGQGIVCVAEENLPAGWVRVYDGTGNSYGPGNEILAALIAAEYDADEVVEVEKTPIQTGETDDEGHTPFEIVEKKITAKAACKGFELAWEALGNFGDHAPCGSHTSPWPDNLISFEQIEEGTSNDNPNFAITIATNAGIRYVAGPHGTDYCALHDWIKSGGDFAESREEAIKAGCEQESLP